MRDSLPNSQHRHESHCLLRLLAASNLQSCTKSALKSLLFKLHPSPSPDTFSPPTFSPTLSSLPNLLHTSPFLILSLSRSLGCEILFLPFSSFPSTSTSLSNVFSPNNTLLLSRGFFDEFNHHLFKNPYLLSSLFSFPHLPRWLISHPQPPSLLLSPVVHIPGSSCASDLLQRPRSSSPLIGEDISEEDLSLNLLSTLLW